MQYMISFMNDYGYLVLFISLILGIMAVPIPIEALMGYAGFLSFQGKLNWIGCIVAAAAGCTAGLIFAYIIGQKLGMPFFEKHGSKIHLGPERLQSTSAWFKKYGNKLLIVVLFIPGVRHLTGYFAGITRLPFRIYTSYSFLGSLVWVSTFIGLGKLLGPKWQLFHELIKKYLIIGSIILAIVIIVLYILNKYRAEIWNTSLNLGKKILTVFHTRGRAELFIAFLSIFTICFIILMISLIQEYLENDVNDIDEVIKILVNDIFHHQNVGIMSFFSILGKRIILLFIIFYTLIWIVWRGNRNRLELLFLFFTVGGGQLYEVILRNMFHKLSPNEPNLLEQFPAGFPSEQSLMAFVIYGYCIFIMLRHSRSIRVHTFLIACWVVVLLFMGISRIYFNIQVPSQIAAGYVFGGVWLGISTLLLEIFRMLTTIDVSKKKSKV
ncbi:VTT domain-containing protein [Bacillus sp. BRMEA1]|uniref:VTT domain-containing protein n=1 Tax=Neobacillus endophyticus TaxID=2738405 RepID=UPI00156688B1|nr:VTT domain-containing protein [Neobacillus endophyticus]NRD79266.1 VTT domain-containing protein [Neobacillus endophyticus]